MKFSTAFAAVLLLAAPAFAQDTTYAGVHAGQHNADNWAHRVDFGAGVGSQGSTAVDAREHWGVFAGRQMGQARFEVEYERGRFDVTAVTLAGVTAARGGSGDYEAVMLNAYRVFDFTPHANGYVAGGVGLANTSFPGLAALGTCNCYGGASRTGAAFQLRAGAEYLLQGGHRLFLQYTLLRLPGADSGAAPSVVYAHKNVGALTAGYRKSF